jgi:hypothetical protein
MAGSVTLTPLSGSGAVGLAAVPWASNGALMKSIPAAHNPARVFFIFKPLTRLILIAWFLALFVPVPMAAKSRLKDSPRLSG